MAEGKSNGYDKSMMANNKIKMKQNVHLSDLLIKTNNS